MKNRWFLNATIVAAAIGGACTLIAAGIPWLLSSSASPELEVRGIEPIGQSLVDRPETEFATFRLMLHNSGRKPLPVSSLQCVPTSVEWQELPLASSVGIASIAHAQHESLRFKDPRVGQPASAKIGTIWIPAGTSSELVVWVRCEDDRPGVRWLDMLATFELAGPDYAVTSPPVRVQAFAGQAVQRLASPGDLHLMR